MIEANTVSLDKISINNPYLRLDGDVETLKKSIERVGLIHPLTINQENELLAGGRRYSALKELGITEAAVLVVDKSIIEQELISIDENLVRKPLSKLEFEKCLNRGRELYEKLNPEATKIDIHEEIKRPAPGVKEETPEGEEDNFASITAQKTGLSEMVIKSAIKRDALASKRVKEARVNGELNASVTNEIIRLSEDEQDKILPFIENKTVKEVRQIVEKVKTSGVEDAIYETENTISMPKELKDLLNNSKKLSKLVDKINLEELYYEGPDRDKLLTHTHKLYQALQTFLENQNAEDVSGVYLGQKSSMEENQLDSVQ